MVWASLISGGKDSVLATQKAIDVGLEVRYLVVVRPKNPDSYMFHSANLDAVKVMAEHAGIEYVEICTPGRKEEELTDLELGLSALEIEGVISGAVESSYQKERIEAIAGRLGIKTFTPLWHMDSSELISEVAERMDAIIVVCAANGLDETFLGAHFDDDLIRRLKSVAKKTHIHLAGEGGEYETLTLNAPFFGTPIEYETSETVRVTEGSRFSLVLGGFH
ncbi:MAG: diphthine--ammonia ligase [Euryarchaeota archaeon]|nr:diphthine--ammonia ligase [Euryarchaeota archaeon]